MEDFKRRIPSWCVRLDKSRVKNMYTIYDCGGGDNKKIGNYRLYDPPPRQDREG